MNNKKNNKITFTRILFSSILLGVISYLIYFLYYLFLSLEPLCNPSQEDINNMIKNRNLNNNINNIYK